MKLSKGKLLQMKREEANNKPMDEENVDETLRWYDKQIDKNPKDTGLFYAKAALLAKEGRYEESIATLDRIIELDPSLEKVWYIKANTLYELQMYEEAIECFDRILEFAEDDERVWYHKGEALSRLGRYKESIECHDKALQLDRNYIEAWLGRGNALRKLRSDDMEEDPEILDEERKAELEDALGSYTVVTDLDPNYEQAWHGKGNVLYKLGRYEEALPCHDKCIEINPDYLGGWYGRGKALQKLEREEEAVQSFETAIGFAPNDALMKDFENWGARANSFYELGRYEEAFECFDKILEKYPDNHYALEGKGAMLEKLGRKEESLQCYKDAIELNSNSLSTWYKMANLLSDAGDYDAAIECYNEAAQIAPGFEEAWYRIGELLGKQNKHEKAQECFSWIIDINPNNIKAKKGLLSLAEDKNICSKGNVESTSQKENGRTRVRKVRKSLSPTLEDVDMYVNELRVPILKTTPLEAYNTDNDLYAEAEVSIENLMIMGKSHLWKREFKEALRCINKALEINPQYWDAWSLKGDVLLEMGKIEDASLCYKKAMVLSLIPIEHEEDNEDHKHQRKKEEWRNTFISLIEDISQDWEEP